MNKKEQAAFEALKKESELNRALRWSDYETEADMPIPQAGYVNGWSYNKHRRDAYRSWSGYVTHGVGHICGDSQPDMASRDGIRQYSTKEKALKAMRRDLEEYYAIELAKIDRQIAAEGGE